MAKQSGLGLALFMLDSNLMSMKQLICDADNVELDAELKAAVYAAIKPILGKRVKERFKSDKVSRETTNNDQINFDLENTRDNYSVMEGDKESIPTDDLPSSSLSSSKKLGRSKNP